MAGLKTEGFSLSALPRGQNIPAGAGAVDVKAIYDGVREGLAAFETVRRAQGSMALADAEMTAKTAEAPLGTRQVLAQTVGIEQQTPLKTAILASEAAIAPEMAEAKRQSLLAKSRTSTHGDVQLLNYIDGLRARVAEDPSDQRTRELLANAEAMATKKSAVSAADPQGSVTANNASREKVAAAGNVSREGVAAAGNTSREGIAAAANISREGIAAKKPLTGLPYILNRLEETRRALIENPDDEAIKLAYLDAGLAFNKYSANSRADPTADRTAKTDTATANRDARTDTAAADREARAIVSAAQNKSRVDAARQSQLGRQAIKAYDEGLKKNEKVQEELVALKNLDTVAKEYTDSSLGAGVFVGSSPMVTLRSLLGDDTGKKFVAATALSMKSAVETMRGLGAMSEREFEAAMSQLPRTNDPEPAIRLKLDYLKHVRTWIGARNDMYLDELANGASQMQAGQAVRKALPMPQMDGESTPDAAQGAAVPNFATPEEADAAGAAGTIQSGQKITVGKRPATWVAP